MLHLQITYGLQQDDWKCKLASRITHLSLAQNHEYSRNADQMDLRVLFRDNGEKPQNKAAS